MKPEPLAVDVSGATGPQTGISSHSPRWALLVSGTAGVLCIALTGAGLVIGGTGSLPWMPGLVVSIAVATVLVARRPRNPISWIMLASALLGSVAAFGFAFEDVDAVPAIGLWAAWLGNAVVVVNTIGLTGAALLLFPNGSLPSPRWRWFARGLWTVIALCAVSFALLPGPLESVPDLVNPIGLTGYARVLDRTAQTSTMLLLPMGIIACASLIMRFRRSQGIARQQIKWLAYAAALFIGSLGSIFLGDPVDDPIVGVLLAVGWSAIPASIGVAVLRYRLYDIDRIISRTVSYGAVIAVLVGVYVAGVMGLGAAVRGLSGDGGGDLVVAASTLAVAAAFGPLRRRVQRLVDRRFNRARYDAAREVERFGAALRDAVDVDRVAADLRITAATVLQPAWVSLWVAGSGGER